VTISAVTIIRGICGPEKPLLALFKE